MRFRFLALAAMLLSCSTGSSAGPTPFEPPDDVPENALRVLFIGNSLTYYNELPTLVAAMARATERERPLAFSMVALPNYSLEDHWADGRARQALQSAEWDFVVLQQGPSSLPQNQAHLRSWAETFEEPIRASGARPALYMVWPAESRSQDFPGVFAAYANAAESVDGVFLPAGQAWRAAWERDASLPLYGGDGFHPSLLGSWLAALVIYSALYDAPATAVPASLVIGGTSVSIPEPTAVILREAATATLETFR